MILDGSRSTEDDDALRLSPEYSQSETLTSESQSRLKVKMGEPEEKQHPAVQPTRESAGRLEMQVLKPVFKEPLSVMWGEESETETFKSQSPRSVRGKGHTELFIEEEEDVREDDKKKDVSVLSERLSPQVEHGVS